MTKFDVVQGDVQEDKKNSYCLEDQVWEEVVLAHFVQGGVFSREMLGGMSSVGKCLDEFLQKAQKPCRQSWKAHTAYPYCTLLSQGVVPSAHF